MILATPLFISSASADYGRAESAFTIAPSGLT